MFSLTMDKKITFFVKIFYLVHKNRKFEEVISFESSKTKDKNKGQDEIQNMQIEYEK